MPVTTFVRDIDQQQYEFAVRVDAQTLDDVGITPALLEAHLRGIFTKPTRRQIELKDPVEAFFTIENDINKMHVDHLVVNLEKFSVFEIVVFLCRYCGWDRIKSYMETYIQSIERGNHG